MVPTRGPLLAGWVLVRVGRVARTRRRYVLLRRDLVLELGSLNFRVVGATVSPHPREKALRLRLRPHSIRISLDTQLQFAKWNDALQTAALWQIDRFYHVSAQPMLAHGVYSVVREATILPPRLRVGPCPAVYTPRLDHFFVPSATHEAFAQNERPESTRTIEKFGAVPVIPGIRSSAWVDDDAPSDSATTVTVGTLEYEPGKRPSASYNGVGGQRMSTSAARLTLNSEAAVVPPSYVAAQLLRVQTGLSPALRASLEGGYVGESTVIVKSIARDGLGRAVAASEALVAHAHLRHHALVRVLDVFETPDVLHVVTERISGPSLEERLAEGAFLERRAARVFRTLLKAVGYMHACGIVHWDIRAINVLLAAPGAPKLVDFGSARPIDPYTGCIASDDAVFLNRRPVACMRAAAPELLAAKAQLYAPKTDMWQMGCLLYRMLLGRQPFVGVKSGGGGVVEDDSNEAARKAIFQYCKLRAPARRAFLFERGGVHSDGISEEAKSLVLELLIPNPRMRPNALKCLEESSFLRRTD